jgi:hypothetical protein
MCKKTSGNKSQLWIFELQDPTSIVPVDPTPITPVGPTPIKLENPTHIAKGTYSVRNRASPAIALSLDHPGTPSWGFTYGYNYLQEVRAYVFSYSSTR